MNYEPAINRESEENQEIDELINQSEHSAGTDKAIDEKIRNS